MPLAFCSWGEAAVPGCWAPICAVGCYSGQLDQDLGHLWGLMTCQKWCLVLTLGQLLSAAMGHRGSAACIACGGASWRRHLLPFASGGLQRPLLNFKGCLLKLLKVLTSSKRLLSLSARVFREMSLVGLLFVFL